MGMALSVYKLISTQGLERPCIGTGLTWVKHIAQGAVIENHDFTEIRLDLSKILDVGPVTESAVLPVVSSDKILALHLQPVDDGIGVFLHRGGEYNEIVPFTDLAQHRQ